MLKMGQEKERKRSKEKIWTASEKVSKRKWYKNEGSKRTAEGGKR